MLVLLLAFGAQRLAAGLFGSEISGFFGTLVATPLGYLIQLQFRGPPATVTFLPSFWLLVPGALGLLSVTRMLSDRAAGLDGLVTVVFVITSIALGTLVGASLYRWLTETFGAWRLQIGLISAAPEVLSWLASLGPERQSAFRRSRDSQDGAQVASNMPGGRICRKLSATQANRIRPSVLRRCRVCRV